MHQQMSLLKQKLRNSKIEIVGVLIILLAWLVVTLVNFPTHSFLSSWDNLHPEFNFGLNLKRTIFGVWQEHQGLGHLGGHGYAATLPHILLTWFISLLVTQMYIRSAFTFACLLGGALGAFFLIKYLLKDKEKPLQIAGATLAGLFYMLNFATVQQFYIQLEAFIVHFVALPWLLYLAFLLLEKVTRKRILTYIVVGFFTSTQGFIPPLFIVFALALGLILFFYILNNPSWQRVKKAFLIMFITFCINAYWLLPIMHYSLTESHTFLNSYNNLLSTDSWVETNNKYGTLKDLSILRGFPTQAVDANQSNQQIQIFAPWNQHLDKPYIQILGYALFGLIFLGLLTFIKQKKKTHELALVALLVIVFAILAAQIPVLENLSTLLQKLPIIKQAFRTGFTKLSIALSLTYAIFLAFGIIFIIEKVQKKVSSKWLPMGINIVGAVCIIAFAWPIFTGHLFYEKAKVVIPHAYFDLFTFFNSQNPNTRIMTLPQGDHWGWYNYRWGYIGSGFTWFGLPQAVTERAFDVWSNYNENYYWELSYALFSNKPELFEQVLEKYQIDWVLLDTSLVPFQSSKYPFLTESTKELVRKSSKLSLIKSIPINNAQNDKLEIFIVARTNAHKENVGLYTDLPEDQNPYQWTQLDQAFTQFKTYFSDDKNTDGSSQFYYPYRSLFTGRKLNEQTFDIKSTDTHFILSTSLPSSLSGKMLNVPNYTKKDLSETPEDKLEIKYFVGSDIYLDHSLLSTIQINSSSSASLVSPEIKNGLLEVVFPKVKGYSSYDSFNPGPLLPDIKRCDNGENGISSSEAFQVNGQNVYQLKNKSSSTCFDIYNPQLAHRYAYIVGIEAKNVSGNPLTFSLINGTSQYADITMQLPKSQNKLNTSYIIVPPMKEDGVGYSIRLANASLTNIDTVNEIGRITVNRIPYTFLTSLFTSDKSPDLITNNVQIQTKKLQVAHIQPAFYEITVNNNLDTNSTLALYQGFDPGWLAFVKTGSFPYFSQLTNHILVNNWANGWRLDGVQSSKIEVLSENSPRTTNYELQTIYLLFWPQLLEFLGFLLLPLPFVFLFKKRQ